MRIIFVAWVLAATALSAQQPSLDYEYFKTKVQPIFVTKRPGHARCISCHGAGTSLRLQPMAAGATSWTEEESRPLLGYLYRHAVLPEFTCRFHWCEGSLAFWDNRSTWHFAVNDYHGERRLLHRITIQGSPLH